MYIKKMLIVNIVCSVLVIIRSQVTTDARIKTMVGFGWGWIWCHFIASKATMLLHPSTTALFVFCFLNTPMNLKFIR